MSLTPSNSGFVAAAESALSSGLRSLAGLFSHPDFSPEAALGTTPGIDPRFLPRVPMNSINLDTGLLASLSNEELKRGKEITVQTHPELYRVWSLMSARAGLQHVPQLILAEHKSPNAMTVSPEEVVLTTGLLQQMDFREVTAVLAHELGHASSDHTKPRVMAYAAFGGPGMLVGNWVAHRGGIGAFIDHAKPNPNALRRAVTWALDNGGKPASLLASAAYIAAGAATGGVVANHVAGRPTELDADRKSALISGDPEGLIQALTKLSEHRTGNRVLRAFRQAKSEHPMEETRIAKLRQFALTMPPIAPVWNSPAAATAPDTQPAPAAPLPSVVASAPSAQISQVAGAERVSAPVQAPAL